MEWQRTLGGVSYDTGQEAIENPDGGFIIVGDSNSNSYDVSGNHGVYDIWVAKVNNAGYLQWQKSLGGWSYDSASSVINTDDGGSLVLGSTLSDDGNISFHHGEYDIWLVKLDESGNIVWEKTYGGSAADIAKKVIRVSDGYVILGSTESSDGDVSENFGQSDFWVFKVDFSGNLIWEKTIGTENYDGATGMALTENGNIYITGNRPTSTEESALGYAGGNVWLGCLSSDGDFLWDRIYGGSQYDISETLIRLSDGTLLIGAHTSSNDLDVTDSFGAEDVWIVHVDQNGEILHQKSYGGNMYDGLTDMKELPDGNIIISGGSLSTDGDFAASGNPSNNFLAKINVAGDLIWKHSYVTDQLILQGVNLTANGGIIGFGSSQQSMGSISEFHGNLDMWLFLHQPEELSSWENMASHIAVFPNPASDFLSIYPADASGTITVSDLSGKILKQASHATTISVEELASGIYLFTYESQSISYHGKFQKK